MGELFNLNSESAYDSMVKTTGAGQVQEWDEERALGGVAGDVRFLTSTTNGVLAERNFGAIGTNVCRFRFYFDLSEAVITDGQTAEIFNVWSSVGFLSRIGILRSGGNYLYRVGQYNDGRAGSKFNNYPITDKGPDYLEIRMVRPTNSTSINGTVSYATGRDGQIGEQTGIDNYDEFVNINRARLGVPLIGGWVLTNPAQLYLGKLVVRDDDVVIGPVDAGEIYGHVLHATNESLAFPMATQEAWAFPQATQEQLTMPTQHPETLVVH